MKRRARLAVALAALVACAVVRGQATQPPPAVPPDKATKPIASIELVNPGFESTAPGQLGAPHGWWAVQHAGPKSYEFVVDPAGPRSGKHSLRVDNVGPEPFGTIYQKVAAKPYRGQTVRFAAWVRTHEAKGNRYGAGAGLVLMAMRSGYAVAHRMMRKDAIHGTTDWTRYEVFLKVPPEADEIELGLNLYGPGRAWLDDVALDVVSEARPEAVSDPTEKRN